MISFFFFTKKAVYKRQLLRIDVETSYHSLKDASKRVCPEVLLFAAAGIYDHDEKRWPKFNYDALPNPRLTESETQTILPDEVKVEVDHTFFNMMGLCWHIISDDRFHLDFRNCCSRFCEFNASLKMGQSAECEALKEFLKSRCHGQLHEESLAYTYFPL
jgi:hypothetical protein